MRVPGRIGQEPTRQYVSSREFPNQRFCGHALARAGQPRGSETYPEHLTEPFQQAVICAGLGDKDRTFEALDRMTVQEHVLI